MLGSLGACLGIFVLGFIIGFPTIALPKLQSEEDSYGVSLNEDEGSWFATISPVVCIFIIPFGGTMSAMFGRRKIILIASPFIAFGWLMTAFASNLFMLFFGRIVSATFMSLCISSIGKGILQLICACVIFRAIYRCLHI